MKTQRRKMLLASGVAGTGVLVTNKHQNKWIKPVVETTILPGHAETSCNESLIIPGFSFSCDPAPEEFDERYAIDDSGPCPVLTQEGNLAALLNTTQVLRVVINLGGPESDEPGFATSISEVEVFSGINGCASGGTGVQNIPSGLVERQMTTLTNGTTWNVSYQVTGSASGATVSDITLTPA